jgi:hypothetical protein
MVEAAILKLIGEGEGAPDVVMRRPAILLSHPLLCMPICIPIPIPTSDTHISAWRGLLLQQPRLKFMVEYMYLGHRGGTLQLLLS